MGKEEPGYHLNSKKAFNILFTLISVQCRETFFNSEILLKICNKLTECIVYIMLYSFAPEINSFQHKTRYKIYIVDVLQHVAVCMEVYRVAL